MKSAKKCRHNLAFGVILYVNLIGLMFYIFRPSLVKKEFKAGEVTVDGQKMPHS